MHRCLYRHTKAAAHQALETIQPTSEVYLVSETPLPRSLLAQVLEEQERPFAHQVASVQGSAVWCGAVHNNVIGCPVTAGASPT